MVFLLLLIHYFYGFSINEMDAPKKRKLSSEEKYQYHVRDLNAMTLSSEFPIYSETTNAVSKPSVAKLDKATMAIDLYPERPKLKGSDPWPKLMRLKCLYATAYNELLQKREQMNLLKEKNFLLGICY